MKLNRRSFLKLSAVGAVSAGVVGGALGLNRRLQQTLAETATAAPDETWVPSVCLQCPGGCGIKVRVIDGRAVKIEGNPDHPASGGRLCPKGQNGLQVLYDPDRIKYPLRRVGARGEDKWERITWEQAMAEVAGRLRELRAQGKSHTVAVVGGRFQGPVESLWGRLLDAYGSPNLVKRGATCSQASKTGARLVMGVEDHLAHDWKNARYVLLFGYSLLEAGRPLTWNLGSYGEMRRGQPLRAKVVTVDPHRSVTAAKSDEWIAIRPGTDAAMALAMAHVIIQEGLYDKEFVEKNSFGFEAFRDLVRREYSPAAAEKITGVPAATITRLAREFATTRPALCDGGDKGTSGASNGTYTRMAILSLNALVGAIDAPGGILVQKGISGLGKWPDVQQDEVSRAGLKQPRADLAKTRAWPFGGNVYPQFFDSALKGDPYPINLMFVYYTNPLFVQPDPAKVLKAYEKIPFIVDFSPFMSESARYADLLLPDRTYLERYEHVPVAQGPGVAVLGLRRPVVKPLHDGMATTDFIIRLAQTMGGSIAASFPWRSVEEVVDQTLATNAAAAADLKARGATVGGAYPFRDYKNVLKTPSGKFEFYSQALKQQFEKLKIDEADLKRMGITARGETLYLPHYEPVRHSGGPAEQYPLLLNTFKTAMRPEGRGANQPFLAESWGLAAQVRWESWVELHPQAAAHLGISTGDSVYVESRLGKVLTRAVVTGGTVPEMVHMPHGLGHKGYGRWASCTGANPNDLVELDYDYITGQVAWLTRVKVYKA